MSTSSEDGFSWYDCLPWLAKLVVYPILVALMLLVLMIWAPIVLSIIIAHVCICGAQDWMRERRLRKALKAQGRILDWPTVESRIQDSQGTVLFEVSPKGPSQAWWIDDNLALIKPRHPLPTIKNYLDDPYPCLWPDKATHEAIDQWSQEHLPKYARTACLTKVPRDYPSLASRLPEESLVVGYLRDIVRKTLSDKEEAEKAA